MVDFLSLVEGELVSPHPTAPQAQTTSTISERCEIVFPFLFGCEPVWPWYDLVSNCLEA